jgi:single-strand DNA-binding protein
MAGSINKVILVGNLGKAPEVRFGQDGSKIVTFPIATSETWKDRTTGERKDRTEWHKVVIFNDKIGEIAEKYLQKGSKIFIEGQLQTRKWTDTAGQERYTTEVVLSKFRGDLTLLDSRSASEGDSSIGSASRPADSLSSKSSDDDKKFDDLNDSIPF